MRPWMFCVHRDAEFWVRSCILRVPKDDVFCLRHCILRVPNEAVFGCVPECCPCTGTVFLIPNDSACRGTKFLHASMSILCEHGRRSSSASVDIVCAQVPRIFPRVSLECLCTGTQFFITYLYILLAHEQIFSCASLYIVRATGRRLFSVSVDVVRTQGWRFGFCPWILRVHRDRCFWARPSILCGHRDAVS
jgi:hypothetical protein